MLVDPEANVILADGYNGGPRGQHGPMCRGTWCERDGLKPENVTVQVTHLTYQGFRDTAQKHPRICVLIKEQIVWSGEVTDANLAEANQIRDRMLDQYQPVPSGTRMELGCHHAESNVIANAAARGVATRGAWLIVTGEPCPMCARLIHHAGIACVVIVRGGYAGGNAGVEYLERAGIRIVAHDGPRDPRMG